MRELVKKLDKHWGEKSIVWCLILAFAILFFICLFFFKADKIRNEGFKGEYRYIVTEKNIPEIKKGLQGNMMYREFSQSYSHPAAIGKSASLVVEAGDVSGNHKRIERIAMKYKGFVESAESGGFGGSILIKVPNSEFENALREVQAGENDVSEISMRNDDPSLILARLESELVALNSKKKYYTDNADSMGDKSVSAEAVSRIDGQISYVNWQISELSYQAGLASIFVSELPSKTSYSSLNPHIGNTIKYGFFLFLKDLMIFIDSLILFIFRLPVLIFQLALFILICVGLWSMMKRIGHAVKKR